MLLRLGMSDWGTFHTLCLRAGMGKSTDCVPAHAFNPCPMIGDPCEPRHTRSSSATSVLLRTSSPQDSSCPSTCNNEQERRVSVRHDAVPSGPSAKPDRIADAFATSVFPPDGDVQSHPSLEGQSKRASNTPRGARVRNTEAAAAEIKLPSSPEAG